MGKGFAMIVSQEKTDRILDFMHKFLLSIKYEESVFKLLTQEDVTYSASPYARHFYLVLVD